MANIGSNEIITDSRAAVALSFGYGSGVSGLVGVNYGIVNHSHAGDAVPGDTLVGSNYGLVEYSYASGNTGLVGQNVYGGVIFHSVSTGNITWAGGSIVGFNGFGGLVLDCHARAMRLVVAWSRQTLMAAS